MEWEYITAHKEKIGQIQEKYTKTSTTPTSFK